MTTAASAHAFSFPAIGGGTLKLADFAGKSVLIVNTASECGYTPQYAGLEELWRRYRDRGLVVLGVPANDFGAQEPGNESAIQAFCRTNYGVDFPMTAKQTVIGGAAHPFYRWIASEFGEAATPKWNFHKYLVAPDGTLAALWPAGIDPLAAEITEAIESTLTP
jgi:glutathione peroxidase